MVEVVGVEGTFISDSRRHRGQCSAYPLRSGLTSLKDVCRPYGARSFCYRYPGFRAAHSILGYDRSSLTGLGAM